MGFGPQGEPVTTDGDWDAYFRVISKLLEDATTLGVFVAQDRMQRAAAERDMTGKLMEYKNIYR